MSTDTLGATAGLQYRRCLAFSDPVHDARVCELRRPQPEAGGADAPLGERHDQHRCRHQQHRRLPLRYQRCSHARSRRSLPCGTSCRQALTTTCRSFWPPTAMSPPTKLTCGCGDGASTCAPATSIFSTCTPTPRSAASTTSACRRSTRRRSAEEGAIMFVDPRPRAHMNRVQNQTTEITFNPSPA